MIFLPLGRNFLFFSFFPGFPFKHVRAKTREEKQNEKKSVAARILPAAIASPSGGARAPAGQMPPEVVFELVQKG